MPWLVRFAIFTQTLLSVISTESANRVLSSCPEMSIRMYHFCDVIVDVSGRMFYGMGDSPDSDLPAYAGNAHKKNRINE